MEQPPSQGAGQAGNELREDAKQIGSTAASRLHSEVDARKGDAVGQARSVSSAIENAAGQLDEGAPAWLRSAFQQGAQQIQRLADTLEQKDSRAILSDIQSFARERPGTFLAACAATGFAAARVLKAGAEQQAGGSRELVPAGGQPQGASFAAASQPAGGAQGAGFIGSANRAPAGQDPLILGSDDASGGRGGGQGGYQ